MRKVITLAVVARVGVAAVLVGPASSQAERKEILAYEKEGGYAKTIDERRKGLSPGDLMLENLPVFDEKTDKQVGETVTVITVVRGPQDNPLLWVDCEVGLERGSITFAGGVRMAEMLGDGALFSVTGGTGKYKDVTGTVVAKHEERDGDSIFTFDFDVLF